MDSSAFGEWWAQFIAHVDRADQHAAAAIVRSHVDDLDESARRGVIRSLVDVLAHQKDGWESAGPALLAVRHDDDTFEHVAACFGPILGTSGGYDDLVALVLGRVLARSGNQRHRELLADFLLRRPLRLGWIGVPRALWPDDKRLYAKAWTRFYGEEPSSRWTEWHIRRWISVDPEPLRAVRDELRRAHREKWSELRAAVESHLAEPWVTEEMRRQTLSVCGATS